jgi:hypothetical protein
MGGVDLPPSKDDRKFIRGKDGWLFLAGDTNDVLGQHSGERRFSDFHLERMRLLLEERSEWLAGRGVPYFFLVGPDAHSVHPEKLPDDFQVAERRPIHQLIDHLAARSSFRIIYPLDELWEQKQRRVYTQTSTHWTQLGALVALGALTDAMSPVVPVKRLAEKDVVQIKEMRPGDLGEKVRPPEESLHVWTEPRDGRSGLAYDNRIPNHGRRIEFASIRGEGICLVFGDSFANSLLPLLAQSFRGLVFAHMPTLDRSLVEEVEPDVVVTVAAERFLIRPPDDGHAPSLLDLEREKRAAGSVMPPRRTAV